MVISAIRLMDQMATPEKGVHSATVVLTTDNGQLCLRARATVPPGGTQTDIAQALIDDALRQIARMPEYRGGQQVIKIADGVRPDPSQGA